MPPLAYRFRFSHLAHQTRRLSRIGMSRNTLRLSEAVRGDGKEGGGTMPHDKTAQTAPAAKGAAKLKMSNTKFKVLLIIPMVIVALVAILATMAGVTLGSTLDTFLGKGETYVETPNDKTAWDSSYYNVQVTEGEE